MDSAFTVPYYQDNTTHAVEYTTIEIAIRSTVVLFVSVTIILSNLLNFVILKTTKHISPVTNVFLTNLTAADFCYGLIACLPYVGPIITGYWPYSAIWCQMIGVVHGTCSAVSIWSVGVIGIERYIATRYPLLYKRKLTLRKSLLIACLLWISGITLLLTPTITEAESLYFLFRPEIGMCVMHCKTKWLCILTGCLVTVLSGVVVIFTTTSITRVLRQGTSANTGTGVPAMTETGLRQRTSSHRDKKAVRLLIVTTGCYFITWGPYATIFFLEIFELGSRFPHWLLFILMWIANSNCFVNVIIYSAIYPSFRSGLKKILYTIFCCPCFRLVTRVGPWSTSRSNSTQRDGR